MVLLGDNKLSLSGHIRELSNRIMVIIGAKDDVSSPESILDLEPEETGLAVLQIPSLEHPLISEGWSYWRHWIVSCAVSFLKEHAERVVKEVPFFRTATNKEIVEAIKSMDEEQLKGLRKYVSEIQNKEKQK
jgi:hypothetical protein